MLTSVTDAVGASPSTCPRNWVEISRPALRRNLRYVRSRLRAGTALCAVVKADAYGHGAPACAQTFHQAGAEWLAVTSVEEGLRLRQAGLDGRILVLGGFAASEAPALVAHGLTPAIWDPAQLHWLDAALLQYPESGRFPFHVKIESGMGRLGLTPAQEADFAAALARQPRLSLEAAFSHLAASEAPDPGACARQFAEFRRAADRLGVKPWHFLNSEGALRFAPWGGMMARVGLALYGYSSQPEHAARLRPALTWKTRVLAVKDLPAGHAIGYGSRFRSPAPIRIAVIAVGYADGYRRDFSPGAHVTLRGGEAPVIGAISMDLTTVDVTHLPPPRLGDEVTLLGPGCDAAHLAQLARTIPYEVLCGLSARVRRAYFDE